jgi:hypothetical protein
MVAMAKGQHLSHYQQGIVRRYYDHEESRVSQKLSELVSEIYLASDEKALAKLWKSAETALAKSKLEPARVQRVLQARDVKALAQLAADLSPGGRAGG